MNEPTQRITSELPTGDPTLLNRLAWTRRWSDPKTSVDFATTARATAVTGTGRRSRVQHGHALCALAWHAKWRGSLNDAMGFCLSAESYLPEKDHGEMRARVYSILGGIHFARNRFDLANCALDRGFWLLRDTPEENVQEALVDLLLTRAIVQRHTGERARAGITLNRAHELCSREMSAGAEYCTATWLLADGDADGARIRAVTAVETARELNNTLIMPYLFGLLAACDIKLGRTGEARDNLATGMTLAKAVDDLRVQCFLRRHSAQLACDAGDHAGAREHLETAAKLAKSLNHAFERKRIALQMADLFEQSKDYKNAVRQHKLAWRLQNETRMS